MAVAVSTIWGPWTLIFGIAWMFYYYGLPALIKAGSAKSGSQLRRHAAKSDASRSGKKGATVLEYMKVRTPEILAFVNTMAHLGNISAVFGGTLLTMVLLPGPSNGVGYPLTDYFDLDVSTNRAYAWTGIILFFLYGLVRLFHSSLFKSARSTFGRVLLHLTELVVMAMLITCFVMFLFVRNNMDTIAYIPDPDNSTAPELTLAEVDDYQRYRTMNGVITCTGITAICFIIWGLMSMLYDALLYNDMRRPDIYNYYITNMSHDGKPRPHGFSPAGRNEDAGGNSNSFLLGSITKLH